MYKLLLFSFMLSPMVSATQIEYKLSYTENSNITSDQLCLKVEFNTNSDENGELEFYFPEYSKNHFVNFHQEGILEKNVERQTYKIKQLPNHPITISMDSCYYNRNKNLLYGLFLKNSFYLQPDVLLPTIKLSDPEITLDIHYDLTQMPADFVFTTSSTTGKRDFYEKRAGKDFVLDIILGSKKPVKSILVNDKPVKLVVENQAPFLEKSFEPTLKKLVKFHRDFFNDNDFEHYFIYAKIENDVTKPKYFSGKHYNNMLTIQGNFDPIIMPGAWMFISHEIFHAWLPKKMPFPDYPNEYHWFIEGVTNHYGRIFCYQSGVVTKKQYIEDINLMLQTYFASPINKIPHAEAVQHFLIEDYSNIAMIRGHLLALLFPTQFDKIITELYNINNKNFDIVNQKKNVDNLLKKYFDKEQYQKILKFAQKGEFEPNDFKDKYTHKDINMPFFQFDYAHLLKNKIVKDLKVNSPEYNAGLREGMEMIDYYLVLNPEKKKRFMVVKTDKGPQKFEFVPEFKTMKIPQLQL